MKNVEMKLKHVIHQQALVTMVVYWFLNGLHWNSTRLTFGLLISPNHFEHAINAMSIQNYKICSNTMQGSMLHFTSFLVVMSHENKNFFHVCVPCVLLIAWAWTQTNMAVQRYACDINTEQVLVKWRSKSHQIGQSKCHYDNRTLFIVFSQHPGGYTI